MRNTQYFQSTDTDHSNHFKPFLRELLFVAVLISILWILSTHNFLLFHLLAEMFSVVVACGVFFVSWNARKFLNHYFLPYLGLAYLHIASLDLLHAFAYKGMGIFADATANLATQLWIAGRFLEAAALLSAPFIVGRRPALFPVASVFTLITSLLLGAIFLGYFPDCYVEGQGLTSFKIFSEYIICLVLFAAAGLFFTRRNAFSPGVLWYMISAIALTILAELTFTQYILLYGLTNVLGHVFKTISYYLIYRATIADGLSKPYSLLFKELNEQKDALTASQEQSLAVLDGLEVGVFVSKMDTCKILYANRFLKTLYGEDIVGKPCFEAITNGAGECCKACMASELVSPDGRPRQAKSQEWRNPRDNRWFLQQERAIQWIDNHLVRLQILTDITPFKEAEQLRMDIERITRHDLKSPLSGMLNFPDLLLSDSNLTDRQREILLVLKETAWRMLNLINRSSDLYKMEHGEYELRPEPVDLARVLRKVFGETSTHFNGTKGRLIVHLNGKELGPEDSFVVSGEELLCFSMLSNLVVNAAEASPKDSDVHVYLAESETGRSVVTIHNQGVIPKEISDRFAQKYVTAGKRHGMGLGAYSAKLMAEVQRGNFSWKSSEEQGTAITIELPRLAN